MSFIVTFKLFALAKGEGASKASERGSIFRKEQEAFDNKFGEALKRLAQTPQVSHQDFSPHSPAAAPAHVIATSEYVAFAESWRVVYQSAREAARFVLAATGSPIIAIIADAFLEEVAPKNGSMRSAIDDIYVDGVPARLWLKSRMRKKERKKLEAALNHARAAAAPRDNIQKYRFQNPLLVMLFVLLFFLLALAWSALDALVRQSVAPSPEPRGLTIDITISRMSALTQQGETTLPSPAVSCVPTLVQRGTEVQTLCNVPRA